MKKSKISNKLINLFIVIALFCFLYLVYRVAYLGLSKEVDGVNLNMLRGVMFMILMVSLLLLMFLLIL